MDGCRRNERVGQQLLEAVVAPTDIRCIAIDLAMFYDKKVTTTP